MGTDVDVREKGTEYSGIMVIVGGSGGGGGGRQASRQAE